MEKIKEFVDEVRINEFRARMMHQVAVFKAMGIVPMIEANPSIGAVFADLFRESQTELGDWRLVDSTYMNIKWNSYMESNSVDFMYKA